METVGSFETSVDFYRTTMRFTPETSMHVCTEVYSVRIFLMRFHVASEPPRSQGASEGTVGGLLKSHSFGNNSRGGGYVRTADDPVLQRDACWLGCNAPGACLSTAYFIQTKL
jgi:hypothetical protein